MADMWWVVLFIYHILTENNIHHDEMEKFFFVFVFIVLVFIVFRQVLQHQTLKTTSPEFISIRIQIK